MRGSRFSNDYSTFLLLYILLISPVDVFYLEFLCKNGAIHGERSSILFKMYPEVAIILAINNNT